MQTIIYPNTKKQQLFIGAKNVNIDDVIKTIANKFNPNLFLYKNENFMPISVQDYCSNAVAFDNTGKSYSINSEKNVLDLINNKVSIANIITNNTQLKPTRNTIYVYARIFINDYSVIQSIDLVYVMLYTYNYFRGCFCINEYNHTGDIEHFTVNVTLNNDLSSNLIKCFYSAHTSIDGTTVESNNIEYLYNKPNVYIANGTHGTYPYNVSMRGCIPRILFCGNDYIGNYAIPYDLVILKTTDLMMQYNGLFGNSANIINQSWFMSDSWVVNKWNNRLFPVRDKIIGYIRKKFRK